MGEFDKIFCEFFLNENDAAAGRPSGRRPSIAAGGMGASAPIITSKDFDRTEIFNNSHVGGLSDLA